MLSLKSTYHILEMVMKMKGAAHFYRFSYDGFLLLLAK